jgi:hypothetical protein
MLSTSTNLSKLNVVQNYINNMNNDLYDWLQVHYSDHNYDDIILNNIINMLYNNKIIDLKESQDYIDIIFDSFLNYLDYKEADPWHNKYLSKNPTVKQSA